MDALADTGASQPPEGTWGPGSEPLGDVNLYGPADPASPGRPKIWMPTTVALASFLVGFPGGLILAARNWHRLNHRALALAHLVAGLLGLGLLLIPSQSRYPAPALGAIINVSIAAYLYLSTARSIKVVHGDVEPAGWLSGFATALGGTVISIGIGALALSVVALARGDLDTPGPGEVRFSVAAPANCGGIRGVATAEEGTPVYIVGRLRHRLPNGTTILIDLSSGSATVARSPLILSGGEECFVTSHSAPLPGPGRYTIRVLDGTTVEAEGSFTVTPRRASRTASSTTPAPEAAGGSAGAPEAAGGSAGAPASGPGSSDQPAWHVASTLKVGIKAFHVAAGLGSVWTANTVSGTLSRVDPTTGTVTSTVRLANPGRPTDQFGPWNIATGAGSVWVASMGLDAAGSAIDGAVVRIDPQTERAVATISVGRFPAAIAADDDAVWVANQLDRTVARIDPRTNQWVATIPVGTQPNSLAVGAGSAWVADSGDGTLSRVDPATNRVAATVKVAGHLLAVAFGDGAVWVTGTEADPNSPATVATTGSAVYRIDPASMQVTGQTAIGDLPTGVAVADGKVWVAEGGTVLLEEVDAATLHVDGAVTIGTTSWDVATTRDSLWVTQPAAAERKFAEDAPGTLTQVRP
jgi:YVTN family beta-propeller protein